MEEKTLLIISVICLCVGLSLLYFASENTELKEADNLAQHLDEDVKITGIVRKVSSHDGITFIEIDKKQNVKVVFFDEIDVSMGELVEITGKVSKYETDFEITGKNIKKN